MHHDASYHGSLNVRFHLKIYGIFFYICPKYGLWKIAGDHPQGCSVLGVLPSRVHYNGNGGL